MRTVTICRIPAFCTLLCAALLITSCRDSSGPATGYAGVWSGTTSQGHPVRFLVDGARVGLLDVAWGITGASCNRASESVFFQLHPAVPFPIENDAFRVTRDTAGSALTLDATFDSDIAASGTLAVSSAQCNGSSDITWTASRATGPAVNLAGPWYGTATSPEWGEQVFDVVFAHSGSTLSGTYHLSGNAAGEITGSITDRLLSFTLISTTGCRGGYNALGAVTVSPATASPASDLLVFAFVGSDCRGGVRFSGSARRSPPP